MNRPPPARPRPAPVAPGDAVKKDEIVVFITRHTGRCAECDGEFFDGSFIRVENGKPLCLDCADLGRLEFLPRGDTALTRRASKHSPLRAVVVQWSRTRQRYERRGVLVSATAIDQAQVECTADAEDRARNRVEVARRREAEEPALVAAVAAAIRRQFPGCPPEEAGRISAWTCVKHSGRVGRSAAAKQLDPPALRLAVIAHIRHEHTGYDRLLMRLGDRGLARQEVQPKIETVLAQWEQPPAQSL